MLTFDFKTSVFKRLEPMLTRKCSTGKLAQ